MSAKSCDLPFFRRPAVIADDIAKRLLLKLLLVSQRVAAGIGYGEGNSAALDGETANGLARHLKKNKLLQLTFITSMDHYNEI